jgi:hypothetical protein
MTRNWCTYDLLPIGPVSFSDEKVRKIIAAWKNVGGGHDYKYEKTVSVEKS